MRSRALGLLGAASAAGALVRWAGRSSAVPARDPRPWPAPQDHLQQPGGRGATVVFDQGGAAGSQGGGGAAQAEDHREAHAADKAGARQLDRGLARADPGPPGLDEGGRPAGDPLRV
eukprot:6668841-Alexandrium_andersonii.AAC.1